MLHKYRGSSSSRLEARQSQREQRHESGPTGAWMQAIGNTRQQKVNMKKDKADLMEEKGNGSKMVNAQIPGVLGPT